MRYLPFMPNTWLADSCASCSMTNINNLVDPVEIDENVKGIGNQTIRVTKRGKKFAQVIQGDSSMNEFVFYSVKYSKEAKEKFDENMMFVTPKEHTPEGLNSSMTRLRNDWQPIARKFKPE